MLRDICMDTVFGRYYGRYSDGITRTVNGESVIHSGEIFGLDPDLANMSFLHQLLRYS